MRRNTLGYAIRLRNPQDPTQVVRAATGETYDDSGWVAAQAEATGGQDEVTDVSNLTVPDIKKLLDDQGTEYPASATKPDLLALLGG